MTVGFSTADGTATSTDSDYVPASGTLTFTPGVTVRNIPVTITPDTKFEPDETFSVVLTNPTGGSVGGVYSGSYVVTILNGPDAPPTGVDLPRERSRGQ